jgi:DNA-binding SARP family transcriptional activator
MPGSALRRRLLTRLAVDPGVVVSVDELIDSLWVEPPRTAKAALHNQISALRTRYGPSLLVTTEHGYRLGIPTDLDEMSTLIEQVRATPADGTVRALLDAAMPNWQGEPYQDLGDHPSAAAARRFAEERRREVVDLHLEVLRRCGDLNVVIAELERLLVDDPYDERRWSVLAETLDAAGRRGDALAAIDRARRALRTGLAVDIGASLRAVERRILGRSDRPTPDEIWRPAVAAARDDDVARIVDELERSDLLVVSGDLGSGVEVVLDRSASAARQRGWRVARTACSPHPETPLAVLHDLAEEVGTRVDTSLGPVEGFVRAVAAAASERTLLLVVDDIHHAGPTTRQALQAAGRVPGIKALASTDRPHARAAPDGLLPGAASIDLEPVPADEIATAVETALGPLSSPPLVDRIVELAGGAPGFAQLLVDGVVRAGTGGPAEGVTDFVAALPTPLRTQLSARFDRLDPAARHCAELVAIAGGRLDTARLARVADLSAAEGAIRGGLLERHGRVLFYRHGIVRDVVLRNIPHGRQAELHHALGIDLLTHGGPANEIATHLCEAGDLDPELAYRTGIAAAVDAARMGAHADAAQWFGRAGALAAALDGTESRRHVEALVGEADERRLAGDPDHEPALLAAVSAAERLGDPAVVARAVFALLQLGGTTGSGAAHPAAELAARVLADAEDPDHRALVLGSASLAFSLSGDAERCRGYVREAIDLARTDEVRRSVLPFTFLGLGHPDDLADRERHTVELLELAVASDDAVAEYEAHHLAFSNGLQRCDGATVRGALARMRELVDQVGDVGRRWALRYQEAALAHLEGDLARAEGLAESAYLMFAPIAGARAFAAYGSQLLPLRWAAGRLDELLPLLAPLVDDQPGVPAWHAAYALALCEQDPQLARQQVDRALEAVEPDFTWLAAHVVAARAAARVSDGDVIDELVTRLTPYAHLGCWQGTCSYGPVAIPLALLERARGDEAAAERAVQTARRLARRLGAPVFDQEITRSFT